MAQRAVAGPIRLTRPRGVGDPVALALARAMAATDDPEQLAGLADLKYRVVREGASALGLRLCDCGDEVIRIGARCVRVGGFDAPPTPVDTPPKSA